MKALSSAHPGSDPGGFHPVFAADLAQYPCRLVPVQQVVDLLHLTHSPEIVARYRTRMGQGARFPPISVVRVPGRYLVADGHKRLQAYLGLSPPPERILLECWTWRRWSVDQWRQFRRQQGRFMAAVERGPVPLFDLLVGTWRHWWRVARSLASFAVSRRSGRR